MQVGDRVDDFVHAYQYAHAIAVREAHLKLLTKSCWFGSGVAALQILVQAGRAEGSSHTYDSMRPPPLFCFAWRR